MVYGTGLPVPDFEDVEGSGGDAHHHLRDLHDGDVDGLEPGWSDLDGHLGRKGRRDGGREGQSI